MKPQKAVLKETRNIAIGTVIMLLLMFAVYAIIGKFGLTVLWGGLYSGLVAVLNFFALGMTVQLSLNGIQSEDENQEKNAKAKMRFSYSVRMLLVFVLAVIAIAVLDFDPLACLLPLLFPRITIAIMNLGKHGRPSGGEVKDGD